MLPRAHGTINGIEIELYIENSLIEFLGRITRGGQVYIHTFSETSVVNCNSIQSFLLAIITRNVECVGKGSEIKRERLL